MFSNVPEVAQQVEGLSKGHVSSYIKPCILNIMSVFLWHDIQKLVSILIIILLL